MWKVKVGELGAEGQPRLGYIVGFKPACATRDFDLKIMSNGRALSLDAQKGGIEC